MAFSTVSAAGLGRGGMLGANMHLNLQWVSKLISVNVFRVGGNVLQVTRVM